MGNQSSSEQTVRSRPAPGPHCLLRIAESLFARQAVAQSVRSLVGQEDGGQWHDSIMKSFPGDLSGPHLVPPIPSQCHPGGNPGGHSQEQTLHRGSEGEVVASARSHSLPPAESHAELRRGGDGWTPRGRQDTHRRIRAPGRPTLILLTPQLFPLQTPPCLASVPPLFTESCSFLTWKATMPGGLNSGLTRGD